jgi:predicted RNase H-like HicB family nuclease
MLKSAQLAYNNIGGIEMIKTFNIIIHKSEEEKGYWAECLELSGCFTQGDTLRETELNMYEAIDLFLEDCADLKYDDYSLEFEVCDA